MPTAHPQIWAWRNCLLIRPTTPTLACARCFFSCGSCRSGRLGKASLPANLLVGAALRADRTRPYETDALERRPYQQTNPVGARLRRDRSPRLLPNHPSHGKRPFFGIIAKPLANRILRDIICLFFERLVISNAMIKKSSLPHDIEFICHPFFDFRDNFGK